MYIGKRDKNGRLSWKKDPNSVKKSSAKAQKKLRPSPTQSATLSPAGTVKVGNDGNLWVIRLDKNGRPSWKKAK